MGPRYSARVIMIDSEGGSDHLGEHRTAMWCAADDHGWHDVLRRPDRDALSTRDVLGWLVELPSDALLVGYSLGYDWAMALYDLSDEERFKFTRGQTARYECYRLRLLGNQVTVSRDDAQCSWADAGNGRRKRVHAKGCACASRTVHDVAKFYQAAFLDAIGTGKGGWSIATPEELAVIGEGKSGRSRFTLATAGNDDAMRYSLTECRVGARMVEALRVAVEEAVGAPLKSFFGAGSIAKLTLSVNGEGKHLGPPGRDGKPTGWPAGTDAAMVSRVWTAYYGGRFEARVFGPVPGPVYESDLTSAYPAQMTTLPCLTHARWVHCQNATRHTLHRVRWDLPADAEWGPFPFRLRGGEIVCPRRGEGWYWHEEVMAAADLWPGRISWEEGWTVCVDCDCTPFAWVPELFEWRMARGNKNDGPGIVAKLGLNSLYGVTAQTVGTPQWASPVWAGLITSQTRAQLLRAIARDPSAVVMVATDGVYSTRDLGLATPGLGGWEVQVHDDAFVVAPGVAILGGKVRSRGMASKEFRAIADTMREEWARVGPLATATATVTRFVGLRRGLVQPHLYATWQEESRVIRIGSGPKREHTWEGGLLPWSVPYVTRSCEGPGGMSAMFGSGTMTTNDAARHEAADQPQLYGGDDD